MNQQVKERLDIQTILGDDPHDEFFDKFTSFASLVLNVPVALVSIVDRDNDRQVFKSQLGLQDPWASEMETPLSHSFCQHVASSDSMFCVEDARENALVKDNLAITDLGVIAYLGCPIRDTKGRAIGSFCAISGEPRGWNDTDKEIIIRIADSVTDLIRLKMLEAESAQHQRSNAALTRKFVESLKVEAQSLLTTLENVETIQSAASAKDISPLVKACKAKAEKIEKLIFEL